MLILYSQLSSFIKLVKFVATVDVNYVNVNLKKAIKDTFFIHQRLHRLVQNSKDPNPENRFTFLQL